MPTYVYEREDKTTFECVQKITEDSLTICPTTGQKVRRIITQSSFHLKGTGWYKTDYANSNSSDKAPENKPKEANSSIGKKPDTSSKKES